MQENSPQTMPEDKKNKNFVLISLVLLVVVAGIVGFFFMKNQQKNNQSSMRESSIEGENADQEMAMTGDENSEPDSFTFADLILNKNGSYVCQIANDLGTYSYYFDNERVAIDVQTPESHMKTIIDEDFTYNWDVDKKVGTKFSNQEDMIEEDLNQASDVFDDEEMSEMEEDVLPKDDVGPFDPADFVCRAWTAEEGSFTPPADVVFQDLSEIQEQMMDFVQ